MTPGLNLVAHFVANPFFPKAGTYSGIFYNTNSPLPDSSGLFKLQLAPSGIFTGRLIMNRKGYPFRARFDQNGSATVPVLRNSLPPAALVFPTDSLETLTVKAPAMGLITAEPNPFRPDSLGVGETTITWMTYATSKVEVHVGAPDGLLFARTGPGRFSQSTGPWVRNGTLFYLQNVSDDLPLAPENTIATVTLSSV